MNIANFWIFATVVRRPPFSNPIDPPLIEVKKHVQIQANHVIQWCYEEGRPWLRVQATTESLREVCAALAWACKEIKYMH